MAETQLKKKFLAASTCGLALAAWIARAALGGVVYATAAFFTKMGWENWGRRNRD